MVESTGDHQRVEIVGLGLLKYKVNAEQIALLDMVHALNRTGLWRDN